MSRVGTFVIRAHEEVQCGQCVKILREKKELSCLPPFRISCAGAKARFQNQYKPEVLTFSIPVMEIGQIRVCTFGKSVRNLKK